VERIEADGYVTSLKQFIEVYNVGPPTAREWYNNGWRDIHDIIKYGLHTTKLTLSQKVFVEHYDDFQEKIPRSEAERIGTIVHRYANKICPGFQSVIVGGYRQGKDLCGDVDVLLTHPDPKATNNFILDIVGKLQEDNWIFHQLRKSTHSSNHDQETTSIIANSKTGLSSLDEAELVWQDADLLRNPLKGKRNVLRRVDIIVSPWKVAGCAIVGWTGATQFERELRSYTREKGMKFDSSGVRQLSDGS